MNVPFVDLKGQISELREEIDAAIANCIDTTAFLQGQRVAALEREFAEFCGSSRAVGCGSGTDALYLALVALGVGPGDEVILPTMTFIATPEAVLLAGARPVFVDVDLQTSNIDVPAISRAVTERTKALLPVHLYGRPAPMKEIGALAGEHSLPVICDAAQAHGAEIDGKPIAAFTDVSCYSFYPGKNLGAFGDAGACVTNDPDLARDMVMRRNHGRTEKYLHEFAGVNMRMDEIQAAVLRVKLSHLPAWNRARAQAAESYRRALAHIEEIHLPPQLGDERSVWHLFVIECEDRDGLRAHLEAAGIPSGIHYPVPLHLQPAFREHGSAEGRFPVAERKAARVLSLPMHERLSGDQILHVVRGIERFFTGSKRGSISSAVLE